MTMRKMALSSRFSWKCSFLADKSQGLSDQNTNTNDSAKGSKKKLYFTVLQVPEQAQHGIITSKAAPPTARSTPTTD